MSAAAPKQHCAAPVMLSVSKGLLLAQVHLVLYHVPLLLRFPLLQQLLHAYPARLRLLLCLHDRKLLHDMAAASDFPGHGAPCNAATQQMLKCMLS